VHRIEGHSLCFVPGGDAIEVLAVALHVAQVDGAAQAAEHEAPARSVLEVRGRVARGRVRLALQRETHAEEAVDGVAVENVEEALTWPRAAPRHDRRVILRDGLGKVERTVDEGAQTWSEPVADVSPHVVVVEEPALDTRVGQEPHGV
jgi:hypothetical protein